MTKSQKFSLVWHTLLCVLLFCSKPSVAFSGSVIPLHLHGESVQALPYMEYMIDPTGQYSVSSLQNPSEQVRFAPLNPHDMPQTSGIVWIRFTLADTKSVAKHLGAIRLGQDNPPERLFLDLGQGTPSGAILYVQKANTTPPQWDATSPAQGNLFALPAPAQEPLTMYLRLDGVPSMWFSPLLRTVDNVATDNSRFAQHALMVTLCVVMFLCLLRGLTEKGQWRIWISLYTAVVLAHVLWGMPATGKGHVSMLHLLAVVLPGVALMLLAHASRHLTQSYKRSRIIDIQYLLLLLPGIAVALLPLAPGYAWTTRYMPLWPALTLLLVPTTLAAWMSALPGARRLLLGCLLPPIGVILAFMNNTGMIHIASQFLTPTFPLWGVALGAIIIATTAAPPEHTAHAQASAEKDDEKSEKAQVADADPNLRLIPTVGATVNDAPEKNTAKDMPTANAAQTPSQNTENALRELVDQLLADITIAEGRASFDLQPYLTKITKTGQEISHILSTPEHERQAQIMMGAMSEHVFDLQSLLRQAHDSISPLADSKNIALSWFMPPHLAQCYRGDAPHLLLVLRRLLESAVCATHRGAVQLSVRRVPESVNPGHLLFTVTDTGTGNPPHERSITAVTRAWELAGKSRGFLGIECGPHGANISFTVHYEATTSDALNATQERDDDDKKHSSAYIIVCSDSDSDRQMWAFFLENTLPRILEARTTTEAINLYAKHGAVLLIFDGSMSAEALAQSVADVQSLAQEHNCPPALCMVLAPNDIEEEHEAFRHMGFDAILAAPITRTALRQILENLLPQYILTTPCEDTHADDDDIIDTGMPKLELHPDTQYRGISMGRAEGVEEVPLDMLLQGADAAFPQETAISPVPQEDVLSLQDDVLSPKQHEEVYDNDDAERKEALKKELTELEALTLQTFGPDAEESFTNDPAAYAEMEHESAPVVAPVVAPIATQDQPSSNTNNEEEEDYTEGKNTPESTDADANENTRTPDKNTQDSENHPAPNLEHLSFEPIKSATENSEAHTEHEQKAEKATETKNTRTQSLSYDGILPTPEMAFGQSITPMPRLSVQSQGNKSSSDVMSKLLVGSATAAPVTAQSENDAPITLETANETVTAKAAHDTPNDTPKDTATASLSEGILLNLEPETEKNIDKVHDSAEDSLFNLVSNLREDNTRRTEKGNAAYLQSFLDLETPDNTAQVPTSTLTLTPEPAPEPIITPALTLTPEPALEPEPQTLVLANETLAAPVAMAADDIKIADESQKAASTLKLEDSVEQPTKKKKDLHLTSKVTLVKTPKSGDTDAAATTSPSKAEPTKPTASTTVAGTLNPSLSKPSVAKTTVTARSTVKKTVPTAKAAVKSMPELAPLHTTEHVPPASDNTLNFLSLEPQGTPAKAVAAAAKPAAPAPAKAVAAAQKDFSFELSAPKETLSPQEDVLQPLEQLTHDLDASMAQAWKHFDAKNPAGVANAAGSIARNAENYALRTLARMARTVESAANARDMECLGNILPDLETTLERTRIGLQQ